MIALPDSRLILNAAVNGLGFLGGRECGGSGLLLALAPTGNALLATVGNLKALTYILCPVLVWCSQVGDSILNSALCVK